MASSQEVAQLFAQQNQMFQAQAAFSQRIGMAVPGSMGGFSPMQFGGMTPGSTFSYAPMGPGFGMGDRAGSAAMGGLAAAGTIASMGIGAAGLMGKIPGAVAPFVDPFASFGLARGMGAGLMGGFAAAGATLGIGAIAGMGLNAMVTGGRQQGAVESALGHNYNFMNPANGMTGSGFTRGDAQGIGAMVRQMGTLPEMMSSMQEITGIMARLPKMGVMQGLSGASDFASKFKEAINTIRDTAKVLGTTMGEAAEFFQHSRGVGFLGRADQLRNALNVQVTSGVTGMTNGQVMAMQSGGADMATAMGGRRGLGARSVTNIAQTLGMAQRAGTLEEGLLEDVTGREGPEAIQAAAGRLAGLTAKMAMGTAAGRALTLGLSKLDDRGRATIDDNLAKRFSSGTLSYAEVMRMAGRNSGNRALAMSFDTRAADLGQEMAGKIGPGGMGSWMGGLVSQYGEEGANKFLQNNGATAGEGDVMLGMGRGNFASETQSLARNQAIMSARRQASDPRAMIRRSLQRVSNSLVEPIRKIGASLHSWVSRSVDEVMEDWMDTTLVALTQDGADKFVRDFSSAGGSGDLKRMFAATQEGKASMGPQQSFMSKHGVDLLGVGVGAVMGGPLGWAGAAAFGGKMLLEEGGSIKQMFAESSITGDTNRLRKFAGGSSLSDRNQRLQQGNFLTETERGKYDGMIRTLIGKNADFHNLGDKDRQDYLMKGLAGQGNYFSPGPMQDDLRSQGYITTEEKGKRIQEVVADYSARNAEVGINFALASGSDNIRDVGAFNKHKRQTESQMRDAFEAEETAIINSNPRVAALLERALNGEDVKNILFDRSLDPSTKAEKLGIKVSDISAAQSVISGAANGNIAKKKEALAANKRLQAWTQYIGVTASVGQIGAEVAGKVAEFRKGGVDSGVIKVTQRVADELARFATDGTKGDIGAAKSAIHDMMKLYDSATGKQKSALAEALGTMGMGLADGSIVHEGSQFSSQASFFKAMGVGAGDQEARNLFAGAFAKSGPVRLTKEQAITARDFMMSRKLVSAGASAGEASIDLGTTLKNIDGNQARITTVLQSLISVTGQGENIKADIKKLASEHAE